MKELLFLVPVVGLAGLLFAIFLKSYVIKQDPGTDRMRIADAIAEGARAFPHFWNTVFWSFCCCIICCHRLWFLHSQLGNRCMFPYRKHFLTSAGYLWE